MASKNIRGITIEIDGATTGLEKSLQDVNKKARDIQSELKEVDRLLKLDPKNTELVTQKQKLLTDAVENTKEKLEKLKSAQEQVNESFKKGEISEDQFRGIQREIIATEQNLKSLESKIDATGDEFETLGDRAKRAGEKMQNIGDGMKNVGGKMSTYVTAPILAGVGLITKGTEELRGDLATLEVNAQQSGNNFEDMKDKMAELTAITGETDSSIEGLNNLMATGFKGDNFTQIMNVMEGAAIKFKDTMKFEGMADGLQETLATGSAIGPFAEMLERSGVNLDEFNIGLTNAIANGSEQNYILQELAKTGLAETAEAYKTNNAEAIASSESQTNLMTQLTDLGTALLPVITSITDAVSGLLTWFNNLSPGMQKVIMVIIGIIAAIGPLLTVIGTVVSIMGTVTAVAGGAGLAIGAMVLPVLAVIAAIAAIITIGVLLYKNWDKIKAFASNLGASLKATFGNIKTAIVTAWNGVITGIKTVWNNVVGFIKGLPSQMLGFGKNIIQGLINGILGSVGSIGNAVKKIGGKILGGVKSFFGIASPATVMIEQGQYVGEGFAIGIENMARTAADSAKALSGAVIGSTTTQMVSGGVDLGGTLNINITGEGANRLNDPRFVDQVKSVILNTITQGNRSIPNRTSLIPIG